MIKDYSIMNKDRSGYHESRIRWRIGTPVDILDAHGQAPCGFGKTITPVFLNRVVVRCSGEEKRVRLNIYTTSRLSASK